LGFDELATAWRRSNTEIDVLTCLRLMVFYRLCEPSRKLGVLRWLEAVIAQLYKNRWQVELFFKWIKHNLRIKKFLGTSENAMKTQVWCAIATYV
jgi:IS4 transposase